MAGSFQSGGSEFPIASPAPPMNPRDARSPIVVARDRELHVRLVELARSPRMAFVAGTPGTGKSLVIHQLAHLAAAAGRVVHRLQWDVVRPVVEAAPHGRTESASGGRATRVG